MRVENDNLIIEKGPSLIDMLDLPPLAEETVEEIEESLDKIRVKMENQSVEDYENNT
ncbi:MAG: hypothetical protein HeimC3_49010 [Candidatus Heimdallarchaeota archaeon LC_3]|nr:MAG: hypothetical protein HeimC3_49010 [Candidatus Heimdallarchaeota archaeon LC_3]